MSAETLGERPNLIGRVLDILIRPQATWARIAEEEERPLLRGYVLPLAAVGAVIGVGAHALYDGLALSADLAWKAASALLEVAFWLVSIPIAAVLINALARRFGAEPAPAQAKKLAAYAATPILVSAFAAIAPPLAPFVVAAGVIYALILFAFGVQPLLPLRDPANNVPRVTLSFAGAVGLIGALAAIFAGPAIHAGREALTGAVGAVTAPPTAPDPPVRSGAEVAIDRFAQSDAAFVLADPARLEAQFPDSLPGGFERRSIVTAQGGGVSRADAVYRQSEATLTVSLIQFSNDIDPAALAAQLAVAPDGVADGGYNRTQTIDGRFYAEEVRPDSSRYLVIGRGVVSIAAGGVTMDQARAAIETIGQQRLEAMFGR